MFLLWIVSEYRSSVDRSFHFIYLKNYFAFNFERCFSDCGIVGQRCFSFIILKNLGTAYDFFLHQWSSVILLNASLWFMHVFSIFVFVLNLINSYCFDFSYFIFHFWILFGVTGSLCVVLAGLELDVQPVGLKLPSLLSAGMIRCPTTPMVLFYRSCFC